MSQKVIYPLAIIKVNFALYFLYKAHILSNLYAIRNFALALSFPTNDNNYFCESRKTQTAIAPDEKSFHSFRKAFLPCCTAGTRIIICHRHHSSSHCQENSKQRSKFIQLWWPAMMVRPRHSIYFHMARIWRTRTVEISIFTRMIIIHSIFRCRRK